LNATDSQIIFLSQQQYCYRMSRGKYHLHTHIAQKREAIISDNLPGHTHY